MSALDLPVIDLRDFLGDDVARRAAFVATLGDALERYGFVAVTGHGIPAALLAEAYAVGKAFFERPDDEKRAYERPEIGRQRGYTGFGVERAKDQAVADLKEFWQVGRELPSGHPLIASGRMPANMTPARPEAFGGVFGSLYAAMDAFANHLLEAIAIHVGLDADDLLRAVREGNSVMRIIHYPPVDGGAPEGAVRSAAHEDINLLTVLPASTQPGLELLEKGTGEWRALTVPADVMVCDTGDIMERLTGGRIRATTHRVVNPPGATNVARYSMPFFCHPQPDWVIRPLQGDLPAITAGEYLRERLIANGVLS